MREGAETPCVSLAAVFCVCRGARRVSKSVCTLVCTVPAHVRAYEGVCGCAWVCLRACGCVCVCVCACERESAARSSACARARAHAHRPVRGHTCVLVSVCEHTHDRVQPRACSRVFVCRRAYVYVHTHAHV